MELVKASQQWAKRPEDEKFSSLADLHSTCTDYRNCAREAAGVSYGSLRVQASAGEVELVGKSNVPSRLTNWAFGQISQRIGAPAGYLKQLPPTLAAQNINYGLANNVEPHAKANLLLHQNGGYLVRAFTSDSYTRIWNSDVTARLIRLTEQAPEWQPAPAAFDGSRGLYASDHDMFAFLVDNERRIFEKDPGGGLSRGFFVWNSEVGASSFGIMTFLYEYVCGNHIVWGAKGVQELRIRHTGTADSRAFAQLACELRKYSESSTSELEENITTARRVTLGANKDEVLDAIFRLKIPALTRNVVTEGYELAAKHSDWYGSPRTVWGMVNGLTEVARDIPFADKRVELDRAAGKLMQVAF